MQFFLPPLVHNSFMMRLCRTSFHFSFKLANYDDDDSDSVYGNYWEPAAGAAASAASTWMAIINISMLGRVLCRTFAAALLAG